ncbi:hypothetical protein [Tolypothrix sp. VBCCA 56010]|uniref:hypothetical protein n=1 Tax=Tolypothrix sp. VBCCA 56010 TaxID=3137731 RepID=UPI003D7DB2FE
MLLAIGLNLWRVMHLIQDFSHSCNLSLVSEVLALILLTFPFSNNYLETGQTDAVGREDNVVSGAWVTSMILPSAVFTQP